MRSIIGDTMMRKDALEVRSYIIFERKKTDGFLDLILSHGQNGMKTSLLTTGPYMDMLFDGMFVPKKQEDGSLLWANPAGTHSNSNS